MVTFYMILASLFDRLVNIDKEMDTEKSGSAAKQPAMGAI